MEDSHICHTDLDNGVSLFGVFDGHGGGSIFTFISNLKLIIEVHASSCLDAEIT